MSVGMKKFFIVGCPRSGTTMVQQALNRHPQIAIPPETKFFFSFYGQTRKQQRRHLDRLEADLKVHLPRPADAIRSPAQGRAFYDEMAGLYVQRLAKQGVTHFGEKTPEHTGHLPRIRKLFPSAKILVVYRDGRDVAASLTKMPWMPANLYVNFMVWLYYNQILLEVQTAGWPNFHFARYEDVVADPRAKFADILRFLELPDHPAVAQGSGNHEGVPEREHAWKRRALGPITCERVGVFRGDLTLAQIEILERLGRRTLPELGYEMLTDGRKPLPLEIMLRLSFEMSKFVYRLPWQSVGMELLNRSITCRANGWEGQPACLPALR
jgi:hypothetical protein